MQELQEMSVTYSQLDREARKAAKTRERESLAKLSRVRREASGIGSSMGTLRDDHRGCCGTT